MAFWDPSEPQTSTLNTTRYIADTLLRRISREPTYLKNLEPSIFERVVAEVFKRSGFNIKLIAGSSDGGVDVLAISPSNLSPTLHLIQCKRYKGKVSVSLVRQLYGVKSDKGANKAVLVTTSSFTEPAIEFAERHSWEISLVGYEELVKWIRSATQYPDAR
jgi:restriction endonuclease Mrr